MPALSAYSNVENTSLIILKNKGFKVWYDEKMDLFNAELNGWDFMANSVTELLGLVAIFEYQKPGCYKEYWWKINAPWLIDDIPKTAPKYTPVWKK
jgi:hypothetical protein